MSPDVATCQTRFLRGYAVFNDGGDPSGNGVLGGYPKRFACGKEEGVHFTPVRFGTVEVELESSDWTPRPAVWRTTCMTEIWEDDGFGSEVHGLVFCEEAGSGKKVSCSPPEIDVLLCCREGVDLGNSATTSSCYQKRSFAG